MAADSSSSSSSNNTREEPIFVLYGSQTGNSEQAAKDFCTELETKFTPSFFEGLGLEPVAVETTCIQLDDFLEYRHAAFTRTMVIFVSSYGVGQAPIGSYKFRSFAEELIKMAETNNGSGSSAAQLLGGLSYALCGLGDSSFTTYLVNPTTICKGLTAAGATQIGAMGKADAKQIGENSQENTIKNWKEELWTPLAGAVAVAASAGSSSSSSISNIENDIETTTKAMQANSIPILMKIDPDYTPPKALGGRSGGAIPIHLVVVALIVALIAALFVSGKIETP